MKKRLIVSGILLAGLMLATYAFANPGFASDNMLEEYVANFTYASRLEMKMDSKGLIELLKEGKAVLVDIRFKEEQQVWGPSFALKIPLNELPSRLAELPKDKIIVTACPHKDRAAIAMTYLRSKGIPARYLTDGLLGLFENLRGDKAQSFIQSTKRLAFQGTNIPLLVAQMADLDQAIIPAASNSNQGNAAKTKKAVARLQSQWSIFLASAKESFTGDQEWRTGLEKINDQMVEVVRATEEENFSKVHEILEGVRNAFERLREERNVNYYLDGFSRYRRVLEKTMTVLADKTASALSDSDLQLIASMVPNLRSSWLAVQAASLDADLFHFDEVKMAEIRSAMDAVQKSINHLESVSPGGTPDQIFKAVKLLKPSLKNAFLMFGKF